MLTSLEIENFKGIAARQRIDFAPLTNRRLRGDGRDEHGRCAVCSPRKRRVERSRARRLLLGTKHRLEG